MSRATSVAISSWTTAGTVARIASPPDEPPGVSIYDQSRADRTYIQIPYSHGEWATLQAGFPLTEALWTALMTMLDAMKPGLVTERKD